MTEYVDLLRALVATKVKFLVVGGCATIAHGYARANEDLDVWIEPSRDNARRALAVLEGFGADVTRLAPETLADPYAFIRVGDDAGRRIDLVGHAAALDFPSAWRNRFEIELAGLVVPFVGLRELIRNKRALGRDQDLADIEGLLAVHGPADEEREP